MMKVIMINDHIINLALVKKIYIGTGKDCIWFHFHDKDDFVCIKIDKKEVQEIFQKCYKIMKEED